MNNLMLTKERKTMKDRDFMSSFNIYKISVFYSRNRQIRRVGVEAKLQILETVQYGVCNRRWKGEDQVQKTKHLVYKYKMLLLNNNVYGNAFDLINRHYIHLDKNYVV